jgi:hypothetical protein
MAENRTAWRELLTTVDEHQKVFNEQLTRLKAENMVPDPESPLLGPVLQYSKYIDIFLFRRWDFWLTQNRSLENLAAKIITEGGSGRQ